MEFRFNFSCDLEEKDGENSTNTCSVEEKTEKLEDFQELFSSKLDNKILSQFHQSSYKFYNVDISCYKSEDIEQWIVENNSAEESVVKSAAASHSDLLPAVYEGGLTVWECGCDLAEFISGEGMDIKGKSVIELGCGAGLPGICAMKCGAEKVYFQDYNSEVISYFTIPNVQLNKTTCQCRFFSGDWGEFQKYARNQPDMRFDYILTAETIYNSENYPKLHSLLKTLLKVDGKILLAAKSHYYGVGGGTRLFEDFITKEENFTYESVKVMEANVPREIIKLERIKSLLQCNDG